MAKNNYKSHYHCVYNLTYHLVLVTKYRRKCLSEPIRNFMKPVFRETLNKWECKLLEFNGEPDHVHLLIETHPALNLSSMVGNIKTVSSRLTRKQFSSYINRFYSKPVLWTRAYCILSTGGASIDTIRKYIENQGNQE